MIIETKFEVGQKVTANFGNDVFQRGYGIVREVNIKVSSVGHHIEYVVCDVYDKGIIEREVTIDEVDLDPVYSRREWKKKAKEREEQSGK